MKTKTKAKMKPRKKTMVIIIIVILLAVAGTITALSLKGSKADSSAGLADAKRYTVEQVSYSQTVEASGNIEAYESKTMSFPMSGTIKSIDVNVDDSVRKDQLLATLDDSSLQYDLAQIDYSIQQNSASNPMQKNLLAMQRALKVAEIDDTDMKAGFSGTVSDIYVDQGDQVASGAEVLRVINTSQMKATVEIDEIDVPLLKEGQRVEFIFDAYPDKRYNGYVAHIPEEGKVTSNGIAILNVDLVLTDPDAALKPAFTFTAEIYVNDAEDVLVVDKNAVMSLGSSTSSSSSSSSSGAGNTGVVLKYTGTDSAPQPTRVEYENYDSSRYRITSGLSVGDVLLSPDSLANGSGSGFNIRVPGMGGSTGFRDGGGRPPEGGTPPNGASGGAAPSGGN